MIAAFSSELHDRRRPAPLKISSRQPTASSASNICLWSVFNTCRSFKSPTRVMMRTLCDARSGRLVPSRSFLAAAREPSASAPLHRECLLRTERFSVASRPATTSSQPTFSLPSLSQPSSPNGYGRVWRLGYFDKLPQRKGLLAVFKDSRHSRGGWLRRMGLGKRRRTSIGIKFGFVIVLGSALIITICVALAFRRVEETDRVQISNSQRSRSSI